MKKKNWWDEGAAVKLPQSKSKDSKPQLAVVVNSIEEIEPLYEPEAAAKVLGVTVDTIYRWKRLGLIEHTPQGRNIRFTAQQIADCRYIRKETQRWRELRKERLFGKR